jgi:hypothetical protein
MKGWLLALCVAGASGACARVPHTRVVIAYARNEAVERVRVEITNATGHELPMPPGGVIEQAVQLVTQQPAAQSTITDAFARAVDARLAAMNIRVVTGEARAQHLRVSLEAWDLSNGNAAGAVVFVTADYQLFDDNGAVLWQVRQARLPVHLSGPNLSRYEVGRAADTCVAQALATLPAHRASE